MNTPEQDASVRLVVRNGILNRFAFHPANDTTGPQHDAVRAQFAETAGFILEWVPGGRHQSLALTALQEAMMWCNAGIACDSGNQSTSPSTHHG